MRRFTDEFLIKLVHAGKEFAGSAVKKAPWRKPGRNELGRKEQLKTVGADPCDLLGCTSQRHNR